MKAIPLDSNAAKRHVYLSKISFAIYFVHILLVTALTWIPAIHLLPVHFKFALLEDGWNFGMFEKRKNSGEC